MHSPKNTTILHLTAFRFSAPPASLLQYPVSCALSRVKRRLGSRRIASYQSKQPPQGKTDAQYLQEYRRHRDPLGKTFDPKLIKRYEKSPDRNHGHRQHCCLIEKKCKYEETYRHTADEKQKTLMRLGREKCCRQQRAIGSKRSN